MTPATYRRKLQKKLKHKPYLKCLKCGERTTGRLEEVGNILPWRHWILIYKCGCGSHKVKHWTGGGTGRHIPNAE